MQLPIRRCPPLFRALLPLLFLLVACTRTAPVVVTAVPVLVYHHFTESTVPETGAVLPIAEFEAQMAWLRDQGYTSISTAQLEGWLLRGKPLPEKPVLITIDDGYRSTLTLALPVLQRFRMKAALFIVSGDTGRTPGQWEHLSSADLRALVKSGLVEIQAHTHAGHGMVENQPALLAWTAAQIHQDNAALRAAFERTGLPPPIAFAYPMGARDDEAVAALREAGYRLAFTVEAGLVARGDDPLALKRQVVYPGTSPCRFAALVAGDARPCEP